MEKPPILAPQFPLRQFRHHPVVQPNAVVTRMTTGTHPPIAIPAHRRDGNHMEGLSLPGCPTNRGPHYLTVR